VGQYFRLAPKQANPQRARGNPRASQSPPADIASTRALAAHAKDEEARRYYEQLDFAASPTDPLHLFVLLKDI